MGQKRLIARIQNSGLKRFIPSGTEPERATGLLPALLMTGGNIHAFGNALAAACPEIVYSPMEVGERLVLR